MTDEQAQLYALLDLVDGFSLDFAYTRRGRGYQISALYEGQGLFRIWNSNLEVVRLWYSSDHVFEATILGGSELTYNRIGDTTKIHLGERLTTKLLRAAYKALNVAPPT